MILNSYLYYRAAKLNSEKKKMNTLNSLIPQTSIHGINKILSEREEIETKNIKLRKKRRKKETIMNDSDYVTLEGGDNIDVKMITALKGYQNDAQTLEEDQLNDLITQISSQLQEIAITGQAARMNYEEYFNHISAHFQPSDISNMMTQYTVGGSITGGDGEAITIEPIFPPTA